MAVALADEDPQQLSIHSGRVMASVPSCGAVRTGLRCTPSRQSGQGRSGSHGAEAQDELRAGVDGGVEELVVLEQRPGLVPERGEGGEAAEEPHQKQGSHPRAEEPPVDGEAGQPADRARQTGDIHRQSPSGKGGPPGEAGDEAPERRSAGGTDPRNPPIPAGAIPPSDPLPPGPRRSLRRRTPAAPLFRWSPNPVGCRSSRPDQEGPALAPPGRAARTLRRGGQWGGYRGRGLRTPERDLRVGSGRRRNPRLGLRPRHERGADRPRLRYRRGVLRGVGRRPRRPQHGEEHGVAVWDRVASEIVFLGPNCVFTNDKVPRSHPDFRTDPADWLPTLLRTGTTVGADATIVCGITLSAWCFVAAGAVVTRRCPGPRHGRRQSCAAHRLGLPVREPARGRRSGAAPLLLRARPTASGRKGSSRLALTGGVRPGVDADGLDRWAGGRGPGDSSAARPPPARCRSDPGSGMDAVGCPDPLCPDRLLVDGRRLRRGDLLEPPGRRCRPGSPRPDLPSRRRRRGVGRDTPGIRAASNAGPEKLHPRSGPAPPPATGQPGRCVALLPALGGTDGPATGRGEPSGPRDRDGVLRGPRGPAPRPAVSGAECHAALREQPLDPASPPPPLLRQLPRGDRPEDEGGADHPQR